MKKIERAQQLLRHRYPQGKFEDIFNEALELLLAKKDPLRQRGIQSKSGSLGAAPQVALHLGMTKKRYIPQKIRREVWKRDKGKCIFQSKDGKQCNERGMLEIDHVQPFALDGKHELKNLRLICASHNKWRAASTFGNRRSLI